MAWNACSGAEIKPNQELTRPRASHQASPAEEHGLQGQAVRRRPAIRGTTKLSDLLSQLLEKPGRAVLTFICRRLDHETIGTSDKQYKHFLANWRQEFLQLEYRQFRQGGIQFKTFFGG
jgi:hypothetical protein